MWLALLLALGAAPDERAAGDAPLCAVRFVDKSEGWAAGADGVLWHTIDGGATWERQAVPTRGRLQALQFLTPYTGLAAGREEVNGGGSAGVLLRTRDGGVTWERLAAGVLPGLQAVQFDDDQAGRVAGDGTDRWPGGLWQTRDGGRTWAATPAPAGGAWLAISRTALAGAWGRLGSLRDGQFQPADVDPPGGRHVRAVAVMGRRAVAVGQAGLVMVSSDSAGVRYGFADLGLPEDLLTACDFRAACVRGDRVWVAGSPGSVVFHSRDGGTTWQAQATGQPLPINALHFIDESTGWAVGELGTILATADGGQTWTVRRRGGQRAAAVCVSAAAKNVPLELVASLGGDAGYLVAALAATAPDPAHAPPAKSTEWLRFETAVRKAGGAAAEALAGFPVSAARDAPDRDALMKQWDLLHAGRAGDRLVARLVLALRVWQPEVVVVDFAGGPAETVLVEAVQAAVAKAGDAAAFPEQINVLKLVPWQVKKLYTLWDGPGAAHVTVPTDAYSGPLGDSPRGHAGRLVGLLGERGPPPRQRGLRLLVNNLPAGQGQGGVMDGIALAPGGTARRAAPALTEAGAAAEKPLRELQALEAVVQTGVPAGGDPGAVLARMPAVLAKLPADRAAAAALAMAEGSAQAGRWDLARETFEIIANRYPGDAAAVEACRWLVRYQASSEARRRHELRQSVATLSVEFKPAELPDARQDPKRLGGFYQPLASGSATLGSAVIGDPAGAKRWYQAALALEPKFAAHGPLVAGDPAVHFCLLAARRQLGDGDGGRAWLRSFLGEQAGQRGADPWRDAARMELWLLDRGGVPPRPTAACPRAGERPLLDARFDDACWRDAAAVPLRTAAGSVSDGFDTKARFAFDDEFLYLAIEAKYAEGSRPEPVGRRTRDMDLAQSDRVEVLLDLDRDYQTAYRFCVDARGALAEDCWGDATWNPRWYVAFTSDAAGYAVEAAIALADLTGEPPSLGKAWALNVVRVVPGRGVLAWSTPADVPPRPEGCGVLMFVK